MNLDNTATSEYQGGDKLILGIVLGVLTFWLFAQSMVNIIPSVQSSLNIPLGSLNLAVSSTALFSGCFIVIAGGFSDKWGRVKITNIGFILSIIGCLCVLLAKEEIVFLLGRVIQGISAACIMPATLALMKTYYSGEARQRALSFWSIGSWGGSGICSLAGGAIATYSDWHYIFVFSIIISIIGMLLIKGTPESKSKNKNDNKFDYLGLFFFIIALFSVNLLITKGDSLGWFSPVTIILFVVFLISIYFFFHIDGKKKDKGFIDFSLFKIKTYSAATVSNFFLNAAAGTLLISSIYVQQGRGYTSFQAGMLTIGYLISVLVMIRVGEKILQKVGAKIPMLIGSVIAMAGIAVMALTFLSNIMYIIAVFIGYILFGIGLGIYATPSTDIAVSAAPVDKVGVASGIYKMASSLGAAFGLAIASSVYTVLAPTGISKAASAGLLVNVVYCLLALFFIIVMMPKRQE